MFQAALLSIALIGIQGQSTADRMLTLATADQPIVHSVVVDAPVKAVWNAWTTKQGMTEWMVASADIDLRVGGTFRTSYTKGSDLKGPDAIVHNILSLDPERMFSFKTVKVPERFPFKKAMESCWTVIYLEPVGEAQTKVVCRMLGYDQTEESARMKEFFKQGNQQTLDALVRRFAKK